MLPKVWISGITFSDGTSLQFHPDEVVLVVGANNSGKSATLRAIREKVVDAAARSPVVKSITVSKEGDTGVLQGWLERSTRVDSVSSPTNPSYSLFGAAVHRSHLNQFWNGPHLGGLTRFFCHLLTADERLNAANPAPAIPLTLQAPARPIHFLQRNDQLESRLGDQFKRAFGVDLVLHRNAGATVPLLTGKRPTPAPGQDRLSYDYLVELEKLPLLQNQGDGMRSFAGVLLEASVGTENVLLIDEPEAFLHPPQARLLGQMLVTEKGKDRQLFLATHSGDFLRGVLDSESKQVTVVRIRRRGDVNDIRQLDHERIRALWSDPLLRYSNVLDGLFHEAVVVTESDSDARFYAAVADALFADGGDVTKPHVMFTHGGGKARLPMIVTSLRLLGVPVMTVTDFDVLNDEHPLRELVEATGGNWIDLESDWTAVKKAVDSKKPELSSEDVAKEISEILTTTSKQNAFPQESKRSIEKILRRSSAWAIAKTVGKPFVPSGTATQACERLLTKLRSQGIFVVEVGELEGFARSVGGHGPAWVTEAIQKNLKLDPELEDARRFVRSIFALRDGERAAIEALAQPMPP